MGRGWETKREGDHGSKKLELRLAFGASSYQFFVALGKS